MARLFVYRACRYWRNDAYPAHRLYNERAISFVLEFGGELNRKTSRLPVSVECLYPIKRMFI